ncbi:unnamed protein product [Linum trigynum]|uniref:Uncharacterized protein n=1 Tax=Linum trigynum TaxID=586398 RepID=A0AAV2ERH5_9ROSI
MLPISAAAASPNPHLDSEVSPSTSTNPPTSGVPQRLLVEAPPSTLKITTKDWPLSLPSSISTSRCSSAPSRCFSAPLSKCSLPLGHSFRCQVLIFLCGFVHIPSSSFGSTGSPILFSYPLYFSCCSLLYCCGSFFCH